MTDISKSFNLDHIIPLNKYCFGENTFNNIRLLCARCNCRKAVYDKYHNYQPRDRDITNTKMHKCTWCHKILKLTQWFPYHNKRMTYDCRCKKCKSNSQITNRDDSLYINEYHHAVVRTNTKCRKRGTIGLLDDNEILQLDEQQKGKCKMCNIDKSIAPGKKLQLDHIIEINDGGSNTIDNIQLLCESCHKIKTSQTAKIRRLQRMPCL